MAEEDEPDRQPSGPAASDKPANNSLGRLLTLSDGVFAIAMTLLALDLQVPTGLGNHVTNHQLIHALAQHLASYWAFILSFYVIATYWGIHRRLMRSVTAIHPTLVRDTVFLLLIVAVMPFPTSLLAQYGSTPFAFALYGAVNALALLALVTLTYDVRRCDPAGPRPITPTDSENLLAAWLNLGVFLLCIPAAFLLGGNAPYVLLLLILTSRLATLENLARRHRLDRLWRRG